MKDQLKYTMRQSKYFQITAQIFFYFYEFF